MAHIRQSRTHKGRARPDSGIGYQQIPIPAMIVLLDDSSDDATRLKVREVIYSTYETVTCIYKTVTSMYKTVIWLSGGPPPLPPQTLTHKA